jgi:lia operon protein LiaG
VPHPVRIWAASLTLATALVAPLTAQQAERFELSGNTITLYNLIGTLRVEAASGGTASAEVARQGADASKLTVKNAGGTLSVVYPGSDFVYKSSSGNYETTLRVRDDGTFNGDWDGNSGRKVHISSRGDGLSAWADIRVMLPAGARADLNLGVGTVTLANVNGTISVETASGDVQATATAGTLSIDTGSGDVTASTHNGDLSVDTGSGNIALSGITAPILSLDTGSGDVRVNGLTGTQLKVDTGSGDIVVTAAAVRGVHVDTGSGDIRVGLTGDIDDLSVDTGSGDVEVTAPKGLGATVTIETSSGDITTEFPLQVTRKGRDGLTGTIGDGKGTMSVDTASGNVTLKQQP